MPPPPASTRPPPPARRTSAPAWPAARAPLAPPPAAPSRPHRPASGRSAGRSHTAVFSSKRRHTRYIGDWSSDVCSSDLVNGNLMHIEFGGFFSSFKTFNPVTSESFTKQGGGEANLNLELVKNFHPIVNTFLSDGGGRYLFGQAPDPIIRPDGSPSPVHASSTTDGFEY